MRSFNGYWALVLATLFAHMPGTFPVRITGGQTASRRSGESSSLLCFSFCLPLSSFLFLLLLLLFLFFFFFSSPAAFATCPRVLRFRFTDVSPSTSVAFARRLLRLLHLATCLFLLHSSPRAYDTRSVPRFSSLIFPRGTRYRIFYSFLSW